MGWDTYKPGDAGKVVGLQPLDNASPGQTAPSEAKANQDGPADDGYHWYSRPFKEGVGAAAANAALATADAATGGQIPRLESWVGVDPTSTVKMLDKAHEDLGVYDYAASGLGYALGPGKVFGALKGTAAGLKALEAMSKAAPDAAALAAKYAPSAAKYVPANLLPNMAASGVEGAASSALGTEGHMGSAADTAKAALTGGAVGTLAGGIGGGGLPSGRAPNAGLSAGELAAGEKQAWKDAGTVNYSPKDVYRAANDAIYDTHVNQPPRAVYDGQNALLALHNLKAEARQGPVSAERLKDYLDKLNVKNTNDQVPTAGLTGQAKINSLLSSGSGAGAEKVAAARQASSRAFAGNTMDEWAREAKLPGSQGSALYPSRARAELLNKDQFYGPAETKALGNLAATGPDPSHGYGFINPSVIRHYALAPAAGAVIGGVGGALSNAGSDEQRLPWWAEAAAGAGVGAGLRQLHGGTLNQKRNRVFDNTRYTVTTGKTPASSPLQDMIRAGLFSRGATGQY
jgi:hypothetical protein